VIQTGCLIAGRRLNDGAVLRVRNPYNGDLVGEVFQASATDIDEAMQAALTLNTELTRYARSEILMKARAQLIARKEEFAKLITSESGLCIRETLYEVGRAADVLQFSAIEALRDDGQMFSGDVSPQGKSRKIFTLREPLNLVAAITPFNHPLNQVAHKVAPAIAVGAPVILKPSEKTPLTALAFAELLYECGLPAPMLSVVLGKTEEVAGRLVQDPRTDLVTFTGSVAVGKRIAATAGYKKIVLELGGNDPLIILDDADMETAVTLAAEGSFRNSGQRCTAVKRILVHEAIHHAFVEKFVAKAREYVAGDPTDPNTRVGTVIDEASAMALQSVVEEAKAEGAKVLLGGGRRGAQIEPTVIDNVSRAARMVCSESFGPLAPIMTIKGLDDAIELANSTDYGLSSGVVTQSLESALACVRRLKAGTVNINEVPGYRIESSPFGGIKDSGLGIKEGVIEAMKAMTYVKTFSLPW